MARPQADRPANNIRFKQIELLKEQTLGVGSYGSVCKAKCDNLMVAAKIIHPTLVAPNECRQISLQRMHRLPSVRFEMECDFLRDIRHPNIIQFLGLTRDPENGLPVLLMELVDESLTHFLESSAEPVPYHIQVAISQDISTALSFLHLNGIIHRDLSSNNILLIGKGVRAKLTDFGMAKLVNVHMTRVSNTVCPGTDAYMPPEAVDNQAVYTEKGDVFSFGVNIIQIVTKKFPKPGDRFKTIRIDHPQVPSGSLRVCAPEVERRNNHISEIAPAHPLLPIALDCLKDQEGQRPSVGDLCQRLAAQKDTPEYRESVRVNDREKLVTQLEEKDQLIAAKYLQLTIKEQVFERLQQESIQTQELLTNLSTERDQLRTNLKARQQENQDLREELRTAQATVRERDQKQRDHEEMISQFQRRINELKLTPRPQPHAQPLSSSAIATPQPSRGHQPAQGTPSTSRGAIRLNWTQGRNAPCEMIRDTDSIMDGNVVYFKPGDSRKVYSFTTTTDTWSRLPDCLIHHTTLAIVNGLLTTIGGYIYGDYTNELFSLMGEGRNRKWTGEFPPMPTKRCWVTVVSTGRDLIAAGGWRESGLTTVEIMNLDTRQWSTAADLPQPMSSASATICGDHIYMCADNSVITCSLPALLQSCRSSEAQPSTPQDHVWSKVANLPVQQSTLVSINNRLLAIGGYDSTRSPTRDVRMYGPDNNSWLTISHFNTPRWSCFSVVLPENEIMIIGGSTSRFGSSETDSVEFGNVV